MEQVEKILISINKFKEKYQCHFSLDIYYNDVDNTFVCKLHEFSKKDVGIKHFRNKKLIDSLLDAYSFCKNYL